MPMRIESPRSDVLLQGKVAEATNEPIFIVRTKESSGVAVKKNAKLHKRMSDVEMQAVTQAQLVRLALAWPCHDLALAFALALSMGYRYPAGAMYRCC